MNMKCVGLGKKKGDALTYRGNDPHRQSILMKDEAG